MAEIVSSAVVQETVSQVLSGLVKKYEEIDESDANRNLERLEMAHIRLEAALETSGKWQITDASLLRWRRKLKHAAQECDDTLHKCKQRILEDEQMEQRVRNSSFPSRIAHATKSFVSSIISSDNNDKLMRSAVQRFEWFADGATEFLGFIDLGGTPRRHISYYSLVNNLFAGKELHHKIVGGNQNPSSQLWLEPFGSAEHGTEAILMFIHTDDSLSVGNIYFSIVLQISESTDIVGTAIQCLQLFAPHFKCTVENIIKGLAQLPTQCLTWMPSVRSNQKDLLRLQIQNHLSQWVRPKPLCCKKHDRHELRHICNPDKVGLIDDFLEPVTEVNLQCLVSLSPYNKQRTLPFEDRISLQDSSYLKAGIYFTPHRSSEDVLPANRFSEIVAIVGEDQHCLQADVTLEQLEMTLPKSIDYFRQNTEATFYKMIWKSKHSSALIQVERESMSTQKTFGGARKRRKLLQGHDEELMSRKCMISHLFDLWRAHVPIHIISAFKDWLQKEWESYSITATPETLNHVT
ncbi:hypothetical protein SETIT_2G018000v2 [Setaria italica]|uniref:Rx N-terminal domain-containing protein n=1 Tax=Setaria italica TaxID=4555 RepID=K3ZSC1_SETIT|nr:uncharacterized protein LOC101761157 [Setaria italica]RCV09320.1 hypothetical protein SETIT_2G018000v2 [Setaria italica]